MTTFARPSELPATGLSYWDKAQLAGAYLRAANRIGVPVSVDESRDVVETFAQAGIPVTDGLIQDMAAQQQSEWATAQLRKAHKLMETHVNLPAEVTETLTSALKDVVHYVTPENGNVKIALETLAELKNLTADESGATLMSAATLQTIRDLLKSASDYLLVEGSKRTGSGWVDRFALSNKLYRASMTAKRNLP